MEEKKYKPIPRFNDHGSGCKGHGNFMLDSTLETEADRQAVIRALDNRISKDETNS